MGDLGLSLFAASGLVWVAVLIPVEIMQARLAHSFARGGDIPPRYWKAGQCVDWRRCRRHHSATGHARVDGGETGLRLWPASRLPLIAV